MATDRTSSFQEITTKAGEAYSHFLTNVQELLQKVYRGELPPSALQERLPYFLHESSADLYRQTSQLSYEFLTGLAGLTTKYSNDFFRGLLPDWEDEPPPPVAVPEPSLSDWNRWYQAFQAHMAEQSHRSVKNYQILLQKVANGELAPGAIQEYSRRFMQERGLDYSRDISQLNLELTDRLVALNQRYYESLFRRLMPDENGSNGTVVPAAVPAETVYLELEGQLSSTVSTSLSVENLEEEPCEVSCAVSDFRNADGTGSGFQAPIEVDPSNFRVRPGETGTVAVRLILTPEQFAAGRNYAATMLIKGRGQQDILAFLIVKVAE